MKEKWEDGYQESNRKISGMQGVLEKISGTRVPHYGGNQECLFEAEVKNKFRTKSLLSQNHANN